MVTVQAGELTFVGVGTAEIDCRVRLAPQGLDCPISGIAAAISPMELALNSIGIKKVPQAVDIANRYRAAHLDHAVVGACPRAELVSVVDGLPTTSPLSGLLIVIDEAKEFFRGKCSAPIAAIRGTARIVCRKLFGMFGKWLGAGIGAILSPPVGAIVGAAVGIALGCAAAKLFFSSV